jgi:hypothetical protein
MMEMMERKMKMQKEEEEVKEGNFNDRLTE